MPLLRRSSTRGKCCSSGQRSSGGWRLTARRVSPIRQINVLTRDLPDGQVWVARFGNGYRHPSSCPGAFGESIRTAWRALSFRPPAAMYCFAISTCSTERDWMKRLASCKGRDLDVAITKEGADAGHVLLEFESTCCGCTLRSCCPGSAGVEATTLTRTPTSR